jgi:phage terminase large subunit-like protein
VLGAGNEKRTGNLIKLAAKRFLADLERTDIYFDEVEASKIVYFAEGYCKLFEDKWRGQAVKILPWMAFIFQQIYGWRIKKTGNRRIRKVYVQIEKKNAKTTLAAVLSNFHLFADEFVQTPKIYVGANSEDQAKLTVTITGKIIEQSPALYEYVEDGEVNIFKYKESIVNVVHKTRDGFIKALSKETGNQQSAAAGNKHGINCSLSVIDEYAFADTDSLLNTMESAQAARENPLLFCITTAGFKKEGPCYQLLRRSGIEILEGVKTDDSYLPLIWEMDKGDQIEDEEVWEKCNPNLNVSVFPEFLRARMKAAQNEGGSKMVDVRTLNFNEWCETPEVWIPSDVWNKNTHGIKVEDLAGRQCFAGLEVISGMSLNCLSLFFPNVSGDKHAVKCIYWMPSDAMQDKNNSVDFRSWAELGLIELCPGNVIDNDFIFNKILEQFALYNVESLAFNKILTNHDILQAIVRAGVKVNAISQGYSGISTPTKEWESLLTAGQIEHFNNPVLAWQNMNTMVNRNKEQEIRVEKSGGRTAGISACVNALAQWKIYQASNMDDGMIESW